MTWNHRVVRTVLPVENCTSPDGRVRHQIAEVYYDENDRPNGWCDAGEVDHFGSDGADWRADIEATVERYSRALEQPVVDFGNDETAPNVKVPGDEWKAMRDDRATLRTAITAYLSAHDSGRSVRSEIEQLRAVLRGGEAEG